MEGQRKECSPCSLQAANDLGRGGGSRGGQGQGAGGHGQGLEGVQAAWATSMASSPTTTQTSL